MTTLTEDIELPGGTDPATVTVRITLWGDGEPVTGYNQSTGKTIAGDRVITGNPWTIDNLVGNADPDLIPAGTVYRVLRTWPGLGDPRVDYVDLPASGTYRVDQVLTDPPATIETSALAAARAQATLESIGAAIDQTAALLVEARWLAFIRDCGSASPSDVSLQFLGGDVTDAFQMPGGDDVLWIGADWFDGTTVTASDLYAGDALPVRNGAVQETTPGTFAVQFHASGNAGVWLDAVSQGGAAAGRIWWPLCILNDNGTMRVGCLLIAPPDAEHPYGIVEASHIVTLTAFATYNSHINVGISGFEIDGMWRDTTHTYIIDERPVDGVKETRLARVTNGSLLTVASWEHWDGSAWVSSAAAAAPLVDVAAQTLTGDADIAKVAEGHYVMVVHRTYDDSHLDVYNAAVPQGPWTSTARVPLGGSIGHTINGGLQISQIPRILDSNVLVGSERPPPEHSMVLMSRNLLDPTGAWSTQNIRRRAPQLVVVPNT